MKKSVDGCGSSGRFNVSRVIEVEHHQMNIISVINTNTVNDIPNALRALANIVEQDIATQGCRANSIGMFGKIDNVSGDFDYKIQQTNITSISELLETR